VAFFLKLKIKKVDHLMLLYTVIQVYEKDEYRRLHCGKKDLVSVKKKKPYNENMCRRDW
jgi:hypothetical protein